ncbi:MAG: leucine-rich repeat domain-containing protein [Eubacterium sp.]|nr:leucine-rich repeat domain-containing protein [Eubacterium sp.]
MNKYLSYKMHKVLLGMILAMVIVLVPSAKSHASEGISYDKTTKTLTITKSGEIKDSDVEAYKDSAEHIIIGKEVTVLGSSVFENFSMVKDITVEKDSKLTKIGYRSVYDCKKLERFTIEEGCELETIGSHAFSYDDELISVDIPDSLKSIGEAAFYYCHKLKSIYLPEGLVSIDTSAFCGCTVLESIRFPSTLDTIPLQVCSGCNGLKEVVFAGKITSIGEHSFYQCSSLEQVEIPSGLEVIPETMFQDCGKLHDIVIPEGVKEIGDGAFQMVCCRDGVSGNLILPDSLEKMGSSLFYWSEFDGIYIPDNVTDIADNCFYRIEDKTTIYYEEGSYAEQFLKDKGITNTAPYKALKDIKYEWAPDGSSCKASAVGKKDKTYIVEEYGTVTSEVIKEATADSKGVTRYTATFENVFFRKQTIDIEDPDPKSDDPLNPDPSKPDGKKDTGKGIDEVEETIINKKDDKDVSGSCFHILQPKAVKVTAKSIKLQWKKVSGANTFVIYGNKCGKKNKFVKIGSTSKNSINIKKIQKKKLKKGAYYKFIVVAVDNKNKVISTSTTLHVATAGGKAGNTKALILKPKKTKVTLKANKTYKFKVKKKNPAKKRVKSHVGKTGIRYESNNVKVATVKNGKIKAVGKGVCFIYTYAQNGVCKKIEVTVK